MPKRTVVQADAIAWMAENEAPNRSSVVTSLPDVSELSQLDFDSWREWFLGAVRRVVRWVPAGGISIFYQSDIRIAGAWIDKGYLVMRGAEEERANIVFHKVVCRKPAGTIGLGRPSYSHMICVSRDKRAPAKKPGPDVLPDAGFMPWSKAMGVLQTGASDHEPNEALSLRDGFLQGAKLFDAGAFWEAHEAWENRWRRESDEQSRRTLQGLIQIAAGFHKWIVMGAPESAARLLEKGTAKIDSTAAGFDGEFAIAEFRSQVEACAHEIESGAAKPLKMPKILG
jgi:hypothetical protein